MTNDVKRRTATIGIIVLAVGLVFVVGGASGELGALTINAAFSQRKPGEYVSAEIVLNATSNLVVSSPAASGGIIHAKDLELLKSSSIFRYAVPFYSTAAGNDVFRSLSGDFYYVAFSSAQPSAKIVATPQGSSALTYGALALLGSPHHRRNRNHHHRSAAEGPSPICRPELSPVSWLVPFEHKGFSWNCSVPFTSRLCGAQEVR